MRERGLVLVFLVLAAGCAASPPPADPAEQAPTNVERRLANMPLRLPEAPAGSGWTEQIDHGQQGGVAMHEAVFHPDPAWAEQVRRIQAWDEGSQDDQARLLDGLLARLAEHGPADEVGLDYLVTHLDRFARLDGAVAAFARIAGREHWTLYPRVSLRRWVAFEGRPGGLADVGDMVPAPYALLLAAIDLQRERGRLSREEARVALECAGLLCRRLGRYTNLAHRLLHALAPGEDRDEPDHAARDVLERLARANVVTAAEVARFLEYESDVDEEF